MNPHGMIDRLTHYQRQALLALTAEPQEQRKLHKIHGVGYDSLKGLWDAGLAITRDPGPFRPRMWRLTQRGFILKQQLEQNQ